VRIRYPGARLVEGRRPAKALLIGAVATVVGWSATGLVLALRQPGGGGLLPDLGGAPESAPARWVLLALAAGTAAIGCWGLYTVFRAGSDLLVRRTFEAEVLRVRPVTEGDDVVEYQVALDEATHDRVRAWSLSPQQAPGLGQRDVVRVTVAPRLRYVHDVSVVRRGVRVPLDEDAEPMVDEVIDDLPDKANSMMSSLHRFRAVLEVAGLAGAGGVEPETLLTEEEVGAVLGGPVRVRSVTGGKAVPISGMRMAEYAAVGGRAKVMVQTYAGPMAKLSGRGGTVPVPGLGDRATIREGAISVLVGEAGLQIILGHVDAEQRDGMLRRLAEIATPRLSSAVRQPVTDPGR
jgi:hypothetical protein